MIAILVTATIQLLAVLLTHLHTIHVMREMDEWHARVDAAIHGTAKDIWDFLEKTRPAPKH